jgi:hypothetical protein
MPSICPTVKCTAPCFSQLNNCFPSVLLLIIWDSYSEIQSHLVYLILSIAQWLLVTSLTSNFTYSLTSAAHSPHNGSLPGSFPHHSPQRLPHRTMAPSLAPSLAPSHPPHLSDSLTAQWLPPWLLPTPLTSKVNGSPLAAMCTKWLMISSLSATS